MDKVKQLVFDFFSREENYRKVLTFCYFLFSDWYSAKDATQDIFVKLVDASENIDFPDDQIEAMRYVKEVARNYRYETIRKSKYQGMKVDNVELIMISEADRQRMSSAAEKLDILNNLIKKKAHFFTDEQLKLWDCMYECLSIAEIEKRLGKERQTIYSLRNKLRDKIRRHIKLEELVD